MLTLLVRRLLHAPATLFAISIIVFVLIHLTPGDPVSFYLSHEGRHVTPATIAQYRHARGLDRNIAVQYLYWARDAARLDLGFSFVDGEPVSQKIAEALPRTLVLNVLALLLAALIGIPLGILLGSRRRSVAREGTHAIFLLLYAVPTFWIALLLMRLFAVRWHLLPLYGMESDSLESTDSLARLVDHARHLVLPVICLSLTQIAIFGRFTSNAMEETLLEDHIRATRARGVGEGRIVLRHALKNAWIPLISLASIVVPSVLSGSVIIERLFQWEGMGDLLYSAVLSRDYPVVMAITLITAIAVLLLTVFVDVLYTFADPRVRLEQR